MPTPKQPSDRPKGNLQFRVPFDETPDSTVNVVAYVFDRHGGLLTSTPLKDGQVDLAIAPAQIRGARLFLGPQLPEGEKQVTLADMERLRAYEPIVTLDPGTRRYDLSPIPQALWKWWIWCQCRVRGRVVKPILVNGVFVERPVCDARVHICEVDKLYWIFPRLPDWVIWRLRDDLIEQLRRPWPIPLPEPPEPFGPIPLPEPSPVFSRQAAPRLRFQSEFSSQIGTEVMLNPQPLPPKAAFEQLSPQIQTALVSPSVQIVRQGLIDNVQLILPYLCLWPWFHPYLCWCDELTTVQTDGHGRFDTTIWYRCFGDHPDLYFWIEYFIGGTWTTVYHPIVCCNTYWDYACGSEVTLRVTDPRVPACEPVPDLPGLQVIITTIGNGVSMSEIQHSGTAQGLTTDGSPFAGQLELRMDLSRSNLIANGITHYRWSYRRLTEGDTTPLSSSDTWHPMTPDVFRFYKVLVPDPTVITGFRPEYPTDKMGPDTAFPGQYLFRIQPITPPAGAVEWSVQNEHVDLAWAYFDTGNLFEPGSGGTVPAAGRYELKLELFKSDGTLVNWSNATGSTPPTPIGVFMSSNAAPFMPPGGMTTAPAGSQHLITDGSGNVVGFRMVLHVDNNHCEAAIADVWVDTVSNQAGPCGFIRFANRTTSIARIAFTARHVYNFASFRFEIDKGSSGPVEAGSADWNAVANAPAYAPVGSPLVNGFARSSASVFSKPVPVATLLDANGTICNEAAFAETLYVAAMAVDGYTRASWLDAQPTPKAFALAPVTS